MKKKIGLILGVTLIASSFSAFAGSTYEGYDVSVPGWNGSGNTENQTKVTIGAAAGLKSTSTDSADVDVRMVDEDGNAGDWARDVNDADTRAIDGSAEHKDGDSVHLQFSTNWNQTTGITAKGTWRSN